MMRDGATYASRYDGNGNITGWSNLTDGNNAAGFEYSPYGQVLSTSGYTSGVFGFSTKYTDPETGLLYFGYRYYDPGTGRWASRDPANEQADIQLYEYVRNRPISLTDPIGLYAGITVHRRDTGSSLPGSLRGHEWLEFSDSGELHSMGFWPKEGTNPYEGGPGEIRVPDPWEGDRSGPTWETEKVDSEWAGIFKVARHMYHPQWREHSKWRGGGPDFGFTNKKDVGCCKDKDEIDVVSCIWEWADHYEKHVEFWVSGSLSTCRQFVVDALGNCCLRKKGA